MDSRRNPLAWLAVLLIGGFAGSVAADPAAAQSSAQLVYRVNHSAFGDIGTYTNTVEPSRDGTTVKTRAHFEVKMLGVRLHREDAERTEQWQGSRLVSFHSVTDKGDGPEVVNGVARGNNFVISLLETTACTTADNPKQRMSGHKISHSMANAIQSAWPRAVTTIMSQRHSAVATSAAHL